MGSYTFSTFLNSGCITRGESCTVNSGSYQLLDKVKGQIWCSNKKEDSKTICLLDKMIMRNVRKGEF